jgi:SPX domain protein involved in polyphosphate accumulation
LGEIPNQAQVNDKQAELRKTMLNLFRSLERVQQFLNVNCTAIEKISKKFDKKIKPIDETVTPLIPQVMPFVVKMNKRHNSVIDEIREQLDEVSHENFLFFDLSM